jgi:predicted aspartyl protease
VREEPAVVLVLALFIGVAFDGVPARCLVDTGASHTVISQEVARSIPGLGQPAQSVRLTAANGTPMNGSVHSVRSVRTQHLSWQDASVVVVPDGVLDKSTPCVLGMNLLGRQPVYFDWQSGQIRPMRADQLA